ncbi:MAG: hydroxymethylpyrimidine/phosphomethylpyrimidine kinase, partial [Burkholderiales bacterium]
VAQVVAPALPVVSRIVRALHEPLAVRSEGEPAVVLTFAGTDPTSGAGIQADLLTLASLGCHAVSVVTAVTVQDTAGVSVVVPLDARLVAAQANTLLADMSVAVFKIGLIGSAENAHAIGAILAAHPDVPVVLDPVLASGRGDPLADEALLDAMRQQILPRATIVTPNSIEARRLARAPEGQTYEFAASASAADYARAIVADGAQYVLVTGTHDDTVVVSNRLFDVQGEIRTDAWTRLEGSYHGSGCTLASAVAALLANGLSVPQAVLEAQEYTWQALAHGIRPGRAQAIPDRLFWARHAGAAVATH